MVQDEPRLVEVEVLSDLDPDEINQPEYPGILLFPGDGSVFLRTVLPPTRLLDLRSLAAFARATSPGAEHWHLYEPSVRAVYEKGRLDAPFRLGFCSPVPLYGEVAFEELRWNMPRAAEAFGPVERSWLREEEGLALAPPSGPFRQVRLTHGRDNELCISASVRDVYGLQDMEHLVFMLASFFSWLADVPLSVRRVEATVSPDKKSYCQLRQEPWDIRMFSHEIGGYDPADTDDGGHRFPPVHLWCEPWQLAMALASWCNLFDTGGETAFRGLAGIPERLTRKRDLRDIRNLALSTVSFLDDALPPAGQDSTAVLRARKIKDLLRHAMPKRPPAHVLESGMSPDEYAEMRGKAIAAGVVSVREGGYGAKVRPYMPSALAYLLLDGLADPDEATSLFVAARNRLVHGDGGGGDTDGRGPFAFAAGQALLECFLLRSVWEPHTNLQVLIDMPTPRRLELSSMARAWMSP